ncbi:hypothetical protein D6D22_09084 [Aureobasidium pullulans]|uniref:Uncharacterized protein n=1 Tax=Aureobasidium pullulans TaxID=5580 RepID=A0A4V6T9C6_AURPU|nr:hypothetical protein D6D22_09084 [Aureobasidium pullulans]
MCVGSIVVVECSACGSEEEIHAYLGCATGEHARSGWAAREDPVINSDSDSDSVRSFQSDSDYDSEVIDPSTAVPTLYYSVGRASVMTEAWYTRAVSSIGPFAEAMGNLIDRAVTLKNSPQATALKQVIELIMLECDCWQSWLDSENTRAIETEEKLSEVLNITGVTAEINAKNIEDMTAEMMELYCNLTTFHVHYDVDYNVGRFSGYVPVIAAALDQLEADEFVADIAAAEAFLNPW